VIYAGDEYPLLDRPIEPETKWRIAAALAKSFPDLKPVNVDREKLINAAVNAGTTAEADYILLQNFTTEVSVEVAVLDDSVGIHVPYWFEGEQAEKVFALVIAYLRDIRGTSGYFVYDPQLEMAFDPAIGGQLNPDDYKRLVLRLLGTTAGASRHEPDS